MARMTMDAGGNTVMMQEDSQDSSHDSSENVSVSSESNPIGISIKGEVINVGDVSVRKEDLILVLMVLNLVMLYYE